MPPREDEPNLYVIIANLSDLRPLAANTVDWLIQVARLIFEALGASSLYTFTTESLESWKNRVFDLMLWRRVEHGEPLEATIYGFRYHHYMVARSPLPHMTLLWISHRPVSSTGTMSSVSSKNLRLTTT